MTPEEFQARFMPYAQGVAQRTGLDPRLVLSQAALETGWGKSAPNNNFFGIKSHGQAGGNTLMTQEFEGGQMVNKPQGFRGYESPEQSFQGYADFILSNPRYRDVMAQGDLSGQVDAMGRSGYATDPEYANKLASIAQRFGGDAQMSTRGGDTPSAVAADTRSALGFPQRSEGSAMMPPREKPQGLLQTLGVQKQGTGGPQGDVPFYQRDRFANLMGGIAMGANTLRQRPDQNIPAIVGQNRQRREGNRTAEWLGQQEGGAEFAQMIASGADPAAVLMEYRNSRMPAATFRQVRGSDLGMTGESAGALFNVGPDGKISGIGGGGMNITNVLPGGVPQAQIGTIPPGYQAVPDGAGGFTMSPVPGSEAALELDRRADKGAAAAESAVAGSVNVLEKVNDVRAEVSGNPLASGILGAITSNVPGTGAYDVEKTAGTIKANLGFDRLTQMRAESPTGGALGAVSQIELDRLESAIASLDLGQSKDQILQNLNDIERQYTRILNNAYRTGDPTRLDAVFGGRPEFVQIESGTPAPTDSGQTGGVTWRVVE